MYFAASAITTTVKITIAAICTQKLLVNPCLVVIWVFRVNHLRLLDS